MFEFSNEARANGYDVIIAGAGGAAHLPGMVASMTTLPVIGVHVVIEATIPGKCAAPPAPAIMTS